MPIIMTLGTPRAVPHDNLVVPGKPAPAGPSLPYGKVNLLAHVFMYRPLPAEGQRSHHGQDEGSGHHGRP